MTHSTHPHTRGPVRSLRHNALMHGCCKSGVVHDVDAALAALSAQLAPDESEGVLLKCFP